MGSSHVVADVGQRLCRDAEHLLFELCRFLIDAVQFLPQLELLLKFFPRDD